MRYFILALLAISFTFAEDVKIPADAQAIIAKMDSTINKARQDAFIKLDPMVAAAMKSGNLELAVVLKEKQKEIGALIIVPDVFGNSQGVLGRWMHNSFINRFEFLSDGTATHKEKPFGKWIIKSNKMIFSLGNGATYTFTLPVKKDILNGVNDSGQAIIFTRLPDAK